MRTAKKPVKSKIDSAHDAFGRSIWDYFKGEPPGEIIEREDDYIGVSLGPSLYFLEYKKWPKHEREGIKFARGRVLDVGAGAGRVALYLTQRGCRVTAIDNSPLAIRVCRARGVKDARALPIEEIGRFKPDSFDTVVMYGNNMGLLGGFAKARRLLRTMHRITSDDARIIAGTTDPYTTNDPMHLAYHRWNRQRGRMSGQIRIRVRYLNCIGKWFDYLLPSKKELEEILSGTGWEIDRYIDSDGPWYVAVMCKV